MLKDKKKVDTSCPQQDLGPEFYLTWSPDPRSAHRNMLKINLYQTTNFDISKILDIF